MFFRMQSAAIIKSSSSNINEVIRVVLNSFFLRKDFERTERPKAPKAPKSTKSTKRYKETQAKAQKRK